MRFSLILALMFISALVQPPQVAVVTRETPIAAKSLSGTVAWEDGGPISGALVQICTPGWKRVLRSVQTDEHGHFSFSRAKGSGMHYLQVSHRGANTLLVKVQVGTADSKDLVIEIEPST